MVVLRNIIGRAVQLSGSRACTVSRNLSGLSSRGVLTGQTQRSLSLKASAPNALPMISQPFRRSFLTSATSFIESRRAAQTKSDVEMSEFLRDEIQAEKESLKATGKAVQVKGFDVSTDEAEVTLKKKFNGEEIVVRVNVNHAVDAEFGEGEAKAQAAQGSEQGMTKMVCRPDFSVEVVKDGFTLGFNCSHMREDEEEEGGRQNQQEGENYQDLFNIDEFSIYKGEFKDSTYVISGEVMDGNFYDNLMNMLDERGINSDFVHEVVDFCTLYEQKLYVNLLENLQNIVKA